MFGEWRCFPVLQYNMKLNFWENIDISQTSLGTYNLLSGNFFFVLFIFYLFFSESIHFLQGYT